MGTQTTVTQIRVRACDKHVHASESVMCIPCATHRRSVFLGMPLGTLLKPCAWQSTCELEQLHLCGHARAAARHSKPHSRANKEPRSSAGRFSRATGAIIPTAEARGKLGNTRRLSGETLKKKKYPVNGPQKSLTFQKKKQMIILIQFKRILQFAQLLHARGFTQGKLNFHSSASQPLRRLRCASESRHEHH